LRVGLSPRAALRLRAAKPVVGVTTLTAYARLSSTENGEHPIIAAIDARHDHVYLQVVSGNGGFDGDAARGAIEKRSRHRASARRTWSAMQQESSPSAGQGSPRRRSRSSRSRRPISSGWRGLPPRSIPRWQRRARSICARPMPNRRPIRCRAPRAARHMIGGVGLVERRHRRRRAGHLARRGAARTIARRVISSRLGRSEFETMLSERNTLVHRSSLDAR
jgi:hypothetical protein